MKILQINASYKPAYIYGGPTMSLAKLSEQLTQAGNDVMVFTTTANGNTELPVTPGAVKQVDGVKVIYFKRLTKDHSHFSPALLRKLWSDAAKYDVIHVHAWWNLVSVLAALVATLKKVPLLISPRGTLSAYSFKNKNSFFKSLIHHSIGKAILKGAYLHATSPSEQIELLQLAKPRVIFNIPNFVKIARPSAKKKENAGSFKLLFFSRIEEKKGLDILLQALPLISVPYHLTIAGDGDETYIKTLKTITVNNSTTDHITWIGFQNENKFDIYAAHQLLVLPSHNENFGNVVIESLSAGTPVLVSEHVGLADYVQKNDLGWVCQTNPQSVADAINNIIDSQLSRLAEISAEAPSIIHEAFNDDQIIKSYSGMYQDIISHGRL